MISDSVGIVLLIFFVVTLVAGTTWAFIYEKKMFNDGKCSHCGSDFRLFDTDSHGGRGYICRKCRYTVWISYNSVDRKYRNSLLKYTTLEGKSDEC